MSRASDSTTKDLGERWLDVQFSFALESIFANGTTTFDLRVGIGYVDLKLTGARTRDNSDSERTPVPAAKSRPP